jgi:hypothetical protein
MQMKSAGIESEDRISPATVPGKESDHGLGYAWAKAGEAVEILATSTLPIKQRLRDAYREFLTQLNHPEHLPEELLKEFKGIVADLTSTAPVGDEGALNATIKVMTEEKASELAKRILALSDKITWLFALQEHELGGTVRRRPLPAPPSAN